MLLFIIGDAFVEESPVDHDCDWSDGIADTYKSAATTTDVSPDNSVNIEDTPSNDDDKVAIMFCSYVAVYESL